MGYDATISDKPAASAGLERAEDRLAEALPSAQHLQTLLARRIGSRQEGQGILATARVLLVEIEATLRHAEAEIGE